MSSVLVSDKNEIRYVSLNRPKLHNAFNPEMIGCLTKIFSDSSSDKSIKVIVLNGVGRSFCSGGDLSWMKSMKDFSFEDNLKDSGQLYDMFFAMRNCLKLIIGKVHGHVFGGGVGLAAICDIAVADEDTVFCFSEVKLGLVPSVISPFVIEKIGVSLAKEFMLTGRKIKAKEAKDARLIHFVGSASELEQYILSLLEQIKSCGPEALEETKKLILKLSDPHPWNVAKKETTQVIAERRVSREGQQGLESFFLKKSPPWKMDSFDEKKN